MNSNVTKKKKGIKSVSAQILLIFILALCAVLVILPLYATIVTSFKSDNDVRTNGYLNFPTQFVFSNWNAGFSSMILFMVNSIIVGLITCLLSLLVAFITAYTFNHFQFIGKNALFSLIIALMVIPSILTLTPQYLLVSALKLKDTWFAVILPGIAGHQIGAIFLFRVFLSQQPKDLFEAGRIDGASECLMMFRIAMPLALPIMMIQGIGIFSALYNDYIWPLLVIDDLKLQLLMPQLKTITVEVGSGIANVGKNNAMFLMSGIPLLIGATFSLKYFINEDFASGLKM